MSTTEALKRGALATSAVTDLADTVTDLAERARSQAETVVNEAKDRLGSDERGSHRGRTLLLGIAVLGAVAAALRFLRRSGGAEDERVIDLTADPVVAPESLPST